MKETLENKEKDKLKAKEGIGTIEISKTNEPSLEYRNFKKRDRVIRNEKNKTFLFNPLYSLERIASLKKQIYFFKGEEMARIELFSDNIFGNLISAGNAIINLEFFLIVNLVIQMAIGDHLNSIDLLNIKIEFGTIYYKIILVYMYYFISIFPQNQNIYRIYPSDKKMNYIIQLWRCNNKKYNDGTKKNLLNINYYIFNCYSKINYISLLYNYNLINRTKRMEIIIDEKEFKNTKIEAKKWLIPYEQSIKIKDKSFYKTVNLSKIRF